MFHPSKMQRLKEQFMTSSLCLTCPPDRGIRSYPLWLPGIDQPPTTQINITSTPATQITTVIHPNINTPHILTHLKESTQTHKIHTPPPPPTHTHTPMPPQWTYTEDPPEVCPVVPALPSAGPGSVWPAVWVPPDWTRTSPWGGYTHPLPMSGIAEVHGKTSVTIIS